MENNEMGTKEKELYIKELLENKKGIDVTAVDLSEATSVADSFVIASGTSVPHVKALCDEVEEKMSEIPTHEQGLNHPSSLNSLSFTIITTFLAP